MELFSSYKIKQSKITNKQTKTKTGVNRRPSYMYYIGSIGFWKTNRTIKCNNTYNQTYFYHHYFNPPFGQTWLLQCQDGDH